MKSDGLRVNGNRSYLSFTEWFAQQTEFETEFECMEIKKQKTTTAFRSFNLSTRKLDGSHLKKTSFLSIRADLDRFAMEFSVTKQIQLF